MKGAVKVLCPACSRLLPLERYTLDEGALVVTCTGCGEATRVSAHGAHRQAAAGAGDAAGPGLPEAVPRASVPMGAPTLAPPRVSLASTPGSSNVVVLRTAGHDAVQKAAAAADEGPFLVPEGVCPKCLAQRAERPTCPHCGIEFARFEEASVLPPTWLKDAWVALLRDWGDDAAHAQLRRKAQQADALPSIGRLYRIRQAWVPEDPIAEEGRADILRLAAMSIGFRPSTESAELRRKVAVGAVVVMCLVLLIILGLQVLRAR